MADGKVIIDTQVNTKGIKSGVQEAQKAVKEFSVSSVAAFAGITLGIGAVVAGLGKLVSQALATADRVDKLSQKIGISTKAFQEWDYALSQSGISIEVLQPAMKTLNDLLTQAGQGSKTAQASFSQLGLDFAKLAKLNPDERLNAVIEALQNVKDPVQRSSLAVDVLGKAATELNVIFNTTSKETQGLKEEAHKLGLVLDEDLIKKGVEAGDAWEDLKKTFKAFTDNLILNLAPALQRIFAALTPGKQMADLKGELDGINARIAYFKSQIAEKGQEGWFDRLFGNSERARENIKALEEQKKAVEAQISAMNKANETQTKSETQAKTLTQEQIAANQALSDSYSKLNENMVQAAGAGIEAMGEALVTGEDAFKAFASTATSAIADVISALGTQTIATGIANSDYGKVSEGLSLKLLAGTIKGLAGKFENGGIVPGNSYSGDKMLARVNSGELILNRAQQANLAAQLQGASVQTNVNVQNYAGADVSVSQSGKDLNVIIERKVLGMLGTKKVNNVMTSRYGTSLKGVRRGG